EDKSPEPEPQATAHELYELNEPNEPNKLYEPNELYELSDSGLLAGTPSIIRVCQCLSVVLSSLGRGSGMGLLNMYKVVGA
ncbi:hypothetical protein LR021_05505, partial [Candidatus Bipolaricaulota bacterium]|nr:hypothetical protein [Candidatus Bipolaricaulota bacterium]